jgi:hypothetical protein
VHHLGEAVAAEHGLDAQDVLVRADIHHLRDNAFIAMASRAHGRPPHIFRA